MWGCRMEYIKLCDICDFQGGSQPPKDEWSFEPRDGYIRMLQIRDFTQGERVTPEYIKITKTTKVCKADDILIARYGASLGKILTGLSGAYNVAIMRTIPNTKLLEKKFLYYYLKSSTFQTFLLNIGNRAAQAGFNKKDLEELRIPNISREAQCEIVSILERVEAIISTRQQQLQKLDDLVKARFVELFVATDAASDWPYCTIADVSNDMRTGPFGSALHHDEFVDSGVFVLGIDNAVENKFSYNRMRYITAEKYQELKRYTVYPGDVIITIMGTVGRSAVIPADMPKAINTKHLACITPNAKMVNAQFLSCAFQVHPDIRAQLQKQCKGAIMDGLNLTIIKGLSFHIPPINLQDRFVGFYEQIDKSKAAVQKALDETQLLFDSLMQKYFG